MRVLEIQLSTLFDRLNQTECLVHILAGTVDAVNGPNDDAVVLHLLGGHDGVLLTFLAASADHPGKNTDALGEYDDALGAGSPQGAGESLLLQGVDVSHSQRVGGVGVHDNAVGGIDLQTGDVAHQVSGQLAGELAAVTVAPKKLCGATVGRDTDQTEIGLGIALDVFEVLAGTGDKEALAD